jgi:hypothetical protein
MKTYTEPVTNRELLCAEALRDMFAMIDEGLLVRDISHDHEPDFYMKAIQFSMRLAKAKKALE